MCCFSCGPDRRERIAQGHLLGLIDQAKEAGFGGVGFSGGEAFLLGRDLVQAVSRAHRAGRGLPQDLAARALVLPPNGRNLKAPCEGSGRGGSAVKINWTVPEFRSFLAEVSPDPEKDEMVAAYRRLYFEPHRAVMEGYLSTHVWGPANLESRVAAMDLSRYRDALLEAERGPLRALAGEALEAAEKALPMPSNPAGPAEAHFIFGFFTMDAGVTIAEGRPVIAAALEVVVRHPVPGILMKHEYGHLFRISDPALLSAYAEIAAHGGLAGGAVPVTEVLVAEGLATLTPAYVDGRLTEAFENPDYLAQLLFFTPDQLARARELEAQIWSEFLPHRESTDISLFARLFFGSAHGIDDEGRPSRAGYYLGSRLVLALVSRLGPAAFPGLLTSPAQRLLDEGCEIMGVRE
jgi:hypothetical protein